MNGFGTKATRRLDEGFARLLLATKAELFSASAAGTSLLQTGPALVDGDPFPGWPSLPAVAEPVIETFVAGERDATPTSENEPFVSAWQPTVRWMNTTVRTELLRLGVAIDGEGYVTASLTPTPALDGTPHTDDDLYMPGDGVGVVAIVGQLAGPRVATAPIDHPPLSTMGMVSFRPDQLLAFASGEIPSCSVAADRLVVFPKFAQLHAGPTADQLVDLAATRQVLVFRGSVSTPPGR